MGEAAEHDVAHGGDLVGGGFDEVWVAVSVGGGPPGAHAVDKLSAVVQGEVDAGGAGDGQRIHEGGGGAVGVPDVGLVVGGELGYING